MTDQTVTAVNKCSGCLNVIVASGDSSIHASFAWIRELTDFSHSASICCIYTFLDTF